MGDEEIIALAQRELEGFYHPMGVMHFRNWRVANEKVSVEVYIPCECCGEAGWYTIDKLVEDFEVG